MEGDDDALTEPSRRRWSRWVVVPSGWLVFTCLVLPTFRFCERGAALPMIVLPPLWPCFVAGAVIALAAASTSPPVGARRGRRLLWFVRLCGLELVAFAFLAIDDVGLGWPAIATLAVGVFLTAASWRPPTERAVATNALIIAAVCTLVAFALAEGPRTPPGAYVYAAVTSALAVGCVAWLVEAMLAGRARSRGADGGPIA